MKPKMTVTAAENDWEEPENAALREHLGARPVRFLTEHNSPHPDRNPCPAWCWLHQAGPHEQHDIEPDQPFVAHHALEPFPEVIASHYPGERVRPDHGSPGYIRPATFAVVLQSWGGNRPRISIHLTYWSEADGMFKKRECMRLNADDADELAAALFYVAGVADGVTEPVSAPATGTMVPVSDGGSEGTVV